MHIDENINRRLDELLKMGEQVLATRKPPPTNTIGFDASVNPQLAYQWATSVQNLLVRVFGHNSEHYKNFTKQVDDSKGFTYSRVTRSQGILKAAKDDYQNEQLFEVRKLVEAEVFDDFLEQAEHLFDLGYYQPAAVIAGSVLEDGLRKLCQMHKIPITDRPKLDRMNADLAKASIFSKLVQKKITALADLRNKASHGQWNQFSKEDVGEMLPAVRRIMEEYHS